MAYFRSDIDIIVFFFVGRDENEWVGKIIFFYLIGSPKVGGAGDGKHKKKYGHPNVGLLNAYLYMLHIYTFYTKVLTIYIYYL